MENFIMSFISISVILWICYAIIATILKMTDGNNTKQKISLFVFFSICAFLYCEYEKARITPMQEIQDYTVNIEISASNIYSTLEEIGLESYVEDDLYRINTTLDEIYHIAAETEQSYLTKVDKEEIYYVYASCILFKFSRIIFIFYIWLNYM